MCWGMCWLAACTDPGATGGPIDAGGGGGGNGYIDGGSGDYDRPPGSGGLTFEIGLSEELPRLGKAVQVDEARFYLRNLTAVGDSAYPMISVADLDFKLNQGAFPVNFVDAPPGLYSNFDGQFGALEGGEEDDRGYRIHGSVMVGGLPVELEIEDYAATSPIHVTLGSVRVEDETVVKISVDLGFLDTIDWSLAPRDATGKIRTTSADDFTQVVRDGIVVAWKLVP